MASVRKMKAEVSRIVDHGDSIYTVELKPEKPIPRFRPGQFLHLALDEYNPGDFWPESRVFSIASSAVCTDFLRICYSVVGRYTGRMEKELVEGKIVWLKLPYGDFVVKTERETVLFAGGTGITAFISYIERLVHLDKPVHLIYGARHPGLLLFSDTIVEQCIKFPGFECILMVENLTGDISQFKNAGVPCREGMTSLDVVWANIINPNETHYYIAGPPSMIEALSTDLRQRGIVESRVHVDAWT